MEQAKNRGAVWTVYLYCLLVSAAFLLICSKSSPLYPLNDWVDANTYFTVGKGFFRGYIPYAELYDQKGPIVFALFGLASLISDGSFLGVYVLETLCFSLFLLGAYQLISLFTQKNRLLALPILAAGVLSSLAFSHGGSVEELCMPIFAWSLYDSMRYFKTQYPEKIPLRTVFVNGLLAGVLLMTKFNLLGFHFAWMAVVAISQFVRREWKHGLAACCLFLGAMALVCVPWVIYFTCVGKMDAFVRFYFYENIFGYSYLDGGSVLQIPIAVIKSTLAAFYRNLPYTAFIILGVVWFTLQKRDKVKPVEKINLWCLCALMTFGVYCGGQGFRYYALVLAAFASLGLIPLLLFWNERVVKKFEGKKLARFILPALIVVCLAFALINTDNRYMLGMRKEETPQGRFALKAEAVKTEETVTLFSYGCPDFGFYLAANVMPQCRFFATGNFNLPETSIEQDALLNSGAAEFVVTANRPMKRGDYRLIDEASLRYEESEITYYLYQRAG